MADQGVAEQEFEQTCDHCGAHFEVQTLPPTQQIKRALYACPECRKSFRMDQASSVRVTMITGRVDGKRTFFPCTAGNGR